jgi:hypothetical protein
MDCCEKYGLMGQPFSDAGKCNCDSYTVVNRIDNGIFNISFWSEDLNTFYETSVSAAGVGSAPTYDVKLKSGTKFSILIHAKLKKTQCFRYAITTEDGKILYEETTYSTQTVMPTKDNKRLQWIFLSSDMPGLQFLQDNIVTERNKLIFRFDIYEYQLRDFSEHRNMYYGSFTLNDSDAPVYKKSEYKPELLLLDYDAKPQKIFPYMEFIKFTKRPLTMEVNLVASDCGRSGNGSGMLKELLASVREKYNKELILKGSKLNALRHKVAKSMTEIEELEYNLSLSRAHYEEVADVLASIEKG